MSVVHVAEPVEKIGILDESKITIYISLNYVQK